MNTFYAIINVNHTGLQTLK